MTPVPGKSKRGNKFVHREAQAAVLRLSIWHKTWPTVPLQVITRKASPYGKLHRESCIYQTKEQEQRDFASEAVDWTHVDPYDGKRATTIDQAVAAANLYEQTGERVVRAGLIHWKRFFNLGGTNGL